MNTTIYYFSGTGNSLSVARKIASLLGDTRLVPIPSVMNGTTDIIAPSGIVGIICPVYDSGIPVLVNDFLKRFHIRNVSYLFAIVTLGGTGGAALKMIHSDLLAMNNRGLDAGFLVKMPGNFPPVSVPPTGEKLRSILERADDEIQRIAGVIKEEKCRRIGVYPVSSLIQAALYGGFAKDVRSMDDRFSVSEACTGCGICMNVCPVRNISIEEKRPVYHHHCELCCACLNFCPVQAIDLALLRGTKGRGRYHHPEIGVADMKN